MALPNLEWEAELLHRADILLNQLQELSERYQALRQPLLPDKAAAWTLLQSTVQQKQRLITKAQDLLGVYPEEGKSLRIQTEKRAREEGFID